MATRGGTVLAVLALSVLPYVLLVTLPEGAARSLLSEDSVVEWMGALAWFVAAVFFTVMLLRRRRARLLNVAGAVWLVGLALMCFVAGGEEISWAQRLLGYDTPGVVARSNLQDEMNIHNLELFDIRESVDGDDKTGLARWLTFNRISTLIWMGYLVAYPLLARFVAVARSLAHRWGPPVPPLAVALAAVINYGTFVVLMASLADPDDEQRLFSSGANEIKETVIALLFAWTAVAAVRRTPTPAP